MADTDSSIARKFRVRFSQIDAARVIYYPRYLEIIADRFPEAEMDEAPFDVAIRFLQPNRLGDEIQMHLQSGPDGWSASGSVAYVRGVGSPSGNVVVRDRQFVGRPGQGKFLEREPVTDKNGKIRFTPDGSRFVLGFRDGTIEVWSTERRQPIVTLRLTTDASLYALDVAGDGRLLAALDRELVALGPWSVGR